MLKQVRPADQRFISGLKFIYPFSTVTVRIIIPPDPKGASYKLYPFDFLRPLFDQYGFILQRHLFNKHEFPCQRGTCCAIMSITHQRKELTMIIEVDFDSDEAIYIQLCNQIIMGIATSVIHEGDSLPSVRQLADTIGVNMHTVNKAYSVLKREGYISLDKRRGAVIALDIDKIEQLEEMRRELKIVLARGCCKNISRQEVHDLVDEIFDDYE